jgi:hypothetical protein
MSHFKNNPKQGTLENQTTLEARENERTLAKTQQ